MKALGLALGCLLGAASLRAGQAPIVECELVTIEPTSPEALHAKAAFEVEQLESFLGARRGDIALQEVARLVVRSYPILLSEPFFDAVFDKVADIGSYFETGGPAFSARLEKAREVWTSLLARLNVESLSEDRLRQTSLFYGVPVLELRRWSALSVALNGKAPLLNKAIETLIAERLVAVSKIKRPYMLSIESRRYLREWLGDFSNSYWKDSAIAAGVLAAIGTVAGLVNEYMSPTYAAGTVVASLTLSQVRLWYHSAVAKSAGLLARFRIGAARKKFCRDLRLQGSSSLPALGEGNLSLLCAPQTLTQEVGLEELERVQPPQLDWSQISQLLGYGFTLDEFINRSSAEGLSLATLLEHIRSEPALELRSRLLVEVVSRLDALLVVDARLQEYLLKYVEGAREADRAIKEASQRDPLRWAQHQLVIQEKLLHFADLGRELEAHQKILTQLMRVWVSQVAKIQTSMSAKRAEYLEALSRMSIEPGPGN